MSRIFRPATANPRLPPMNRSDQTIHLLDVTPHEIIALKPAGLASELPRDPAADSFVRRLAAQGFSDLRLVHRLDAPSCGLMLVARSAEAAATIRGRLPRVAGTSGMSRRWRSRAQRQSNS